VLILFWACNGDAPPCAEGYGRANDGSCVPFEVGSDGGDSAGPVDDTERPPGDTSAPVGLVEGGVIACDEPLAELRYTELAASMGLRGPLDPEDEHPEWGSGAVFDADGDGDLDVALAWPSEPPVLFLRDGAGFVEKSLPAPAHPWNLALGDLDGDQDLDLVVTGFEYADGSGSDGVVLQNDGGSFTVAATLPAPAEGLLREVALGDLDGDGDLDGWGVVTSREHEQNAVDLLLENDGHGGFTATQPIAGTIAGGKGFDAQWFDWDGDLDLDLYVVNDFGTDLGGNTLYENVDGQLSEGSDACACGIEHAGMGVTVGDVNGDGRPDLFLTDGGSNKLLQQLEDASYVDVSLSSGANQLQELSAMGWGATFLDHDQDGLLDIVVAIGDLWGEDKIYSDVESTPEGDHDLSILGAASSVNFIERRDERGTALEGSWRAVIADDHNGDGVPDLLAVDVAGPPALWLSDGCTEQAWLEVAAPPGSRVEVSAGGTTFTGWTTHDSGSGGARSSVAHVGLGPVDSADVVVTTPRGASYTASDVAVRQRLATP